MNGTFAKTATNGARNGTQNANGTGGARTSIVLAELLAKNVTALCAMLRITQSQYIEGLVREDFRRRKLNPDIPPLDQNWALLREDVSAELNGLGTSGPDQTTTPTSERP